ncbi:hypothetical protein HPB51_002463 [Rhipicephalus microplus]|uniref:Splicing factor 3a subunit 3 n=1 Tax=Rhipicephalus microplus TaxID=6941 RepID=A0A9J6DES4_RHIMP|nr:hypothetical protein HPB51_002463 [Rhipicephalus microplus]
METILEQQRRYHEERERLIDAQAKEMLHRKSTNREQINSDHRLKILLDRYMECTSHLKELYEDKDGLRKEEIAALSGPNEFAEFYSRLRNIKEFHRKHPNEIQVPMSVEFDELNKARENPSEEMMNLVDFTDEEGYGKYLDLHECYEKYVNLKGIEKVDYLSYLSSFDQLFDIPKDKKNSEYKKYLDCLLDYLQDYALRVKPLLDINQEMENVMNDFEKQWEAGTFPGWQGKQISELDPSLFAKSKPGRNKDSEKQKEIATLEAQLYRFAEILSEQRQATKENVQRKQARTVGEREESDNEISESESEDEDNDVIYNPKNLPLGWDGKEWRHAHGMRCLGIPNTAHFANVTQIEDALTLWNKLKDEKSKERFQASTEEEYEDTQGNVVNKKTFEDLKRQGLL